MKPHVSLITLGVADLEQSRAFYRDGLGFKLSSASNDSVCFFHMNGSILGLFGREALAEDAQVDHQGGGFEGITLAHNVGSKEEVDQLLQQAESAGAVITKPAQDVFWGGYNGYFKDPDGHLWEVAWNPFFPLREDGTIELP